MFLNLPLFFKFLIKNQTSHYIEDIQYSKNQMQIFNHSETIHEIVSDLLTKSCWKKEL